MGQRNHGVGGWLGGTDPQQGDDKKSRPSHPIPPIPLSLPLSAYWRGGLGKRLYGFVRSRLALVHQTELFAE
jgi:hypothetical protein